MSEPIFKVGDVVLVVDDRRKLRVSFDGSENPAYVRPMDEFCGKFATVMRVSVTSTPEPTYYLRLEREDGATASWYFLESHIMPPDDDDELDSIDGDALIKLVFG